MAAVTGLLAAVGVFLAGPWRTLQRRRPDIWGPRISARAHANVSLAAAVLVVVHAGPPLGISLTWVATWLFVAALVSGFYGMYQATGPGSRRRWLRRHRVLTAVLYAALAPHVIGSLLGWAMIGGVAVAGAVWWWRLPIAERLGGLESPLRRRQPVLRPHRAA